MRKLFSLRSLAGLAAIATTVVGRLRCCGEQQKLVPGDQWYHVALGGGLWCRVAGGVAVLVDHIPGPTVPLADLLGGVNRTAQGTARGAGHAGRGT